MSSIKTAHVLAPAVPPRSRPIPDRQRHPRFQSLGPVWHSRDFRLLWGGETISQCGSEITQLALPLTAILILHATAFEIGLLDMFVWLPYLCCSLVLGVGIDRCRRRPLMILAHLVRAGCLALIPLAWVGHWLTFPMLCIVAFITGVFAVIFTLAYQAYLPLLLPPEQILAGNSALQSSASLAKIAGPGMAGFLIQALSAPLALIVDAVSFLVAGVSTLGIHTNEPLPRVSAERHALWQEIQDGLRFTFQQPSLRKMVGMASLYNLGEQMFMTIWTLFALKQGITPIWLGSMLAVGSVGALVGSLGARPLATAIGMPHTLRWAIIASVAGLLLIPFAGGSPLIKGIILACGFGINGLGLAVLNISVRSIRQQTVPPAMLGRVLASYTCFAIGVVPLGAFCAGTIAGVIGLRATLLVGGIITLFAIPWVWNLVDTPHLDNEITATRSPHRAAWSSQRAMLRVPRPFCRSNRRQPNGQRGSSLKYRVFRELAILWGFLGYDCTATVLPALCFTLAALPYQGGKALLAVGYSLLYFTCFGLCFTIANQVVGIEEDRHNKPDRPLVSGLLTVRSAWIRWAIIVLLFLALGMYARILPATLLWVLIAASSAAGWDARWWWKQLIMGLGVLVELSAAWQLAAPLTPLAARWILCLAVIVLAVIALQDLRDIAGDRVRGRRTLPIILGDQRLRRWLIGLFVVLPVAVHLLLAPAFAPTMLRVGIDVVLAGWSWSLAWRLWFRQRKQSDHDTYMLFTGWYCATLAGFAVLTHYG